METPRIINPVSAILGQAIQKIKKEREQIEGAYRDGTFVRFFKGGEIMSIDDKRNQQASDYFTKTYNQ